jgi:dipeptidyl aminopeptidase/acylaminoacyl peptidase
VWRIPADGGTAERITAHNSRVAYPVPLDERLLLYTATADDGTGPWLYAMDLKDRVPQRATRTVEHYISIAASAEVPGHPRRLVATVSNPTVQLWTVPITDRIAMERDASRRVTPTSRSAAPRFGPNGVLVYLASRGGAYGLCRQLSDEDVTDVWKAGEGAVDGPAAVSPDGRTVCVPVRRRGRSTLYLISIDGTAARPLAESLDVTGAASWSADGKWLAVAAKSGTGAHLFKVPVDGGPPVQIVASVSSNPVWAPNGAFIVYSGAGRARSVPVEAVTADGERYPIPELSVDRVGDSYRFLPGGNELVVKLGGFRHQDFWLFDLATGQRRQLTRLRPGASLHRFDVSPDGRQILFERVQENSSIVLIELPRR